MEHPYQAFFGLRQPPFNITPDPAFLYRSPGHQEAFAQLRYGIEARKGFIVLTGEVGTGKTTLIHALLRELGGSTHTALIFSMITDPVDLLRCICDEFGLVDPKQPRGEVHDYTVLLNGFLLENYRNGVTCALIIDEAQNLSVEVLENIRLLSNFETATDKLLQILLVGQPELAVRLNSPQLRQLKQRVTLRYHLRNLDLVGCREYIAGRLAIAGGDPGIFSGPAVETVFVFSGGIPRLINTLCDNALLTAYAVGRNVIDRDIIREVAADLHLEPQPVPRRPSEALSGRARVARAPGSVPSPERSRRVAGGSSEAPQARPRAHNGDGKIAPVTLLDGLTSALVDAMGPMARIVIRDEIRNLGETYHAFPADKIENLVEGVSKEILDDAMRARFRLLAEDRARVSGLSVTDVETGRNGVPTRTS